jgi:hypothetical protein
MCGRPCAAIPLVNLFAMDAKDGDMMDMEEGMAAPVRLSG